MSSLYGDRESLLGMGGLAHAFGNFSRLYTPHVCRRNYRIAIHWTVSLFRQTLSMISLVSLLGIGTVLLLLAYKWIIYPAFISPLAKVPNAHPSTAISGWWLKRQQDNSRELKSLLAAHQKHGPIVRIAKDEISVSSLEGLRLIYAGGFEKAAWYADFTNYGFHNIVAMVDSQTHSFQKRMFSNVYSKSFVQRSPDLEKVSSMVIFDRFLPLLDELAKNNEDSNVVDLVQWACQDLFTGFQFGIQNGTNFLQNREAREYYFKNYRSFMDVLNNDVHYRIEEVNMSMCKAALADIEGDTEPTTYPVVFGKLYTGLKNAKSVREEDVLPRTASEMMDDMIANYEGTGVGLTYTLYRLSQNEDMQAQLRSELLTLTPPVGAQKYKLPTPASIEQLPLLDAIVHETLRLHPATPGRQPRIVPRGGTVLDRFMIPEGTTVSSNAYTLHRNEEVYENAFEWLPRRWLPDSSDAENKSSLDAMRRWFWAFSSGGRGCIGSHFAMQGKRIPPISNAEYVLTISFAEMKLLLAAIYTNFTTSIIDDEGIEQREAFVAGPMSDKLILRFHKL